MENTINIRAPTAEVEEYYAKLDLQETASKLHVPTNDDDVRKVLRDLNETVELPNEDKYSRRQRLSVILARNAIRNRLETDGDQSIASENSDGSESNNNLNPISKIVPGAPELRQFRQHINDYADGKLKQIQGYEVEQYKQFKLSSTKYMDEKLLSARKVISTLETTELFGSQNIWKRPIAAINISKSENFITVGDYSGQLSLLDLELEPLVDEQNRPIAAQTHAYQACCIELDEADKLIFSGDNKGEILINNYSLEKVSNFVGHTSKITGLQQQMPNILISSSNSAPVNPGQPSTFGTGLGGEIRVWDIQTTKCHFSNHNSSSAINDIKLHESGCLLLTGEDNGAINLIDLRIGKPATSFVSHASGVTSLSWRPESFEFASGGKDNVCLINDIRQPERNLNRIFAHADAISSVSFTDKCLVTAGFDKTIKLWSKDTYRLIKNFPTLSKIICLDARVVEDDLQFVTGRWDKCVDLYMKDTI